MIVAMGTKKKEKAINFKNELLDVILHDSMN